MDGGDYYKAKVWHPKAIKQMIRNRVYLGHLLQGKTRQALYEHQPSTVIPESEWHVTENTHEPIVSTELWEAANAVEQARRKQYYEDRNFTELPDNIFRGFLECAACGTKLVRRHSVKVSSSGKRHEYFHYCCSLKHQHPEQPFSMVRYETICDTVFPMVANRLNLVTEMGAIIEKRAKSRQNPRIALDTEIAVSSREIEKKSGQLVRLYEDYAGKILSEREYLQIKGRYEAEADALRRRLDDLAQRAALMANTLDSDNRWIKATQEFVSPKTLTREMLEALVDKIVVDGSGHATIIWKFDDDFALLESFSKEVGSDE